MTTPISTEIHNLRQGLDDVRTAVGLLIGTVFDQFGAEIRDRLDMLANSSRVLIKASDRHEDLLDEIAEQLHEVFSLLNQYNSRLDTLERTPARWA